MAHISDFLIEMGILLIFSAAVSQHRVSQKYTGQKIILLLQELCYLPDLIIVEDIKGKIIKEFSNEIEIVVVNETVICHNNLIILSILKKEMEDQNTIAVVGSVEPFLCKFISELSDAHRKLFIAWNCPQINEEESNTMSHMFGILPSVRDVVGAIFSLFKHFRWKYSTVVTVENGAWWTRIGSELEFALSNENVSLSSNTFIVLPATSSELFIKRQFYRMMPTFKLNATMKSDFEGAVILCIPEYSYVFWKILRVFANLQIFVPVLIVQLSSNFYVYQHFTSQQNIFNNYYEYMLTSMYKEIDNTFDEENGNNFCNSTKMYLNSKTDILGAHVNNWIESKFSKNKSDQEYVETRREYHKNVTGLNNVRDMFKHQLLLASVRLEQESMEPFLVLMKLTTQIIHSRRIFRNSEKNSIKNELNNGQFLLSDLTNTSTTLLHLWKRKNCSSRGVNSFDVISLISDFQNWYYTRMQKKYNMNKINSNISNCLECENDYFEIFKNISLDPILLTLFTLLIIAILLLCLMMAARKHYITRRRMKDPCKILLTSEDIVFPQISESSRFFSLHL